MKPFEDLDDVEVLALSQADIDRYIDLECAEAGVQLLTDPPVLPESVSTKPDQEVYTVPAMLFIHRTQAEQVAALASTFPRYKTGYVGNSYSIYKVIRDDDAVDVSETRYFSEAFADARAGLIDDERRLKEEYQKERNRYDLIISKRAAIDRRMKTRVASVQQARARAEQLRQQHARYLELADGNRRVAARFLAAAFPEAETAVPELFEFTAADLPDPKPRNLTANRSEGGADADSQIPF